MIAKKDVIGPCWKGDINVSLLTDAIFAADDRSLNHKKDGVLQDLQFLPISTRDLTPPFPQDTVPTVKALLDLSRIPLWMFADMKWNLQTTNPRTANFFEKLLQWSPLLPDNSFFSSLLLTSTDTSIIIIAQRCSNHSTLLARALHPPSLIQPSLNVKRESPSPPPLPSHPPTNPFEPSFLECEGQFLSVLSPQRISAREASCSQFDAKLESPGRNNLKVRRERRVQSLLPDIARRRKAELENPFALQKGSRQGSIVPSRERKMTVAPAQERQQSAVPSQAGSRQRSAGPSQESSRQGSSSEKRHAIHEGSIAPSPVEVQTKAVVKQTVIAALRLHSMSPSDADYRGLINETVNAVMFALRVKLREGKTVGMGEIGSVVESLLEIFLN